jgi:Fe2+ transport system protein FeoA
MKSMRRGNKRISKEDNLRNLDDVVPLTSLRERETGVVVHAVGGFGLVRRLAEMGLTPGVEVKVLRTGPFRGPFEIEVRGVALALGRGVASRVFVRPLRSESNG